ncbi:MAG: DUF2807 domain-containing protein [Pseudomonadota bacterium]
MTAHPVRLLPLLLLLTPAAAQAEERRYMLSGFDRVRVEGPFEVTVTAGGSPNAVASGDARAIDTVNVRVQGTTLIVSAGVNGWGGYPGAAKAPPRVIVTVPALRSAAVIGGGRLTIDRMRGQRIDLTLTGSGRLAVGDAQADRIDATLIGTGQVTVAGKALQGRFQSNGAGAIDAGGMDVADLRVTWQSAGDGRFAARNTADVQAAGQGAITVAGAPACTVSGGGPVVCGKR